MMLRRVSCWLLIAACFVMSSEAFAARRGGTHVYLLRGLFNVSVGLDALAVKIARRGIPASVHGHGDSGFIAAQAIAEYRAGRVRSIMLVGHSLGVGGAVMTAKAIGEAGVPVSLLISLDPVSPHVVSSNVQRTVNYYTGVGATLSAAAGSRGTLRNVDLSRMPEVGHMSIQSLEAMHQRILGVIAGR